MTTTAYLALVPRDGLFCKDGRDWHTSASGRGHGLDWPWPSTVLGALRSAWGRSEEARSGELFGPSDWRRRTAAIQLGRTLVLRRQHGVAWRVEDTTWPVPMDALWTEAADHVVRLDPVPPDIATLGRDDDGARERLWRPRLSEADQPLEPPRWWSSTEFTAWLAGEAIAVRDRDTVLATVRRIQVRVRIRPEKLTADDADDDVLFSHDVVETLEPRAEWAIGVEVTLPNGRLSGIATLGSDARLARIEPLQPLLFEPPGQLLAAFRSGSRGLRLVAVTPLCFARGWLPDSFAASDNEYRGHLPGLDAKLILRAAFVPRPVHVSGWDMAANDGKGGPKPTSRMVAPGAVYFFERADGRPFGEADARSLWLAAMGSRTDEGFGRVVGGVWTTPAT
jgi:CRISPR-associated protein Cmr3